MRNLINGTLIGLNLLTLIACTKGSSAKKQYESLQAKVFTGGVQTLGSFESNCKHVVNTTNGSFTKAFFSIQNAIQEAKPGTVIIVGGGEWPEKVQLKDKDSLKIKSNCSAKVHEFEIKRSRNILIDGFEIIGSSNTETGISIEDSSSVTINENRIHNLKNGSKAIWIGPNSTSTAITKNYIHHNKSDGMVFSESEKGGRHFIKNNIIFLNGKDGIVIGEKQVLKFDHNIVMANGGYGVRKNGESGSSSKNIMFVDNVITYNNGKVKVSISQTEHNPKTKESALYNLFFPVVHAARRSYISSRDLASFATYLDSTDTGNITTTGVEGQGVRPNIDKTAPTILLKNHDNFLTAQSAYLLTVQLEDSSPINVDVYQNGVKIYNSQDFIFDVPVTLREGVNVFQIQAMDRARNVGSVSLNNIVLDTTPPSLTAVEPNQSGILYTNKLPYLQTISISSNEPVTGGTINGQSINLSSNQNLSSVTVDVIQPGSMQIEAKLFDLVGNVAVLNMQAMVRLDNLAPVLTIGIKDNTVTNQPNFFMPVKVDDESPVVTKVFVNDVEVFQTSAAQFDAAIALTIEGANIIKIQSTDAAGNISVVKETTIIRDMSAPVLKDIYPANNSIISGTVATVGGSSNERLASVTVNGQPMTVSDDGLSFLGAVIFEAQGQQQLLIEASDLAGNSLTEHYSVQINPQPSEVHSNWTYEECPLQL